MPKPDTAPDWLPELLALASWPRPTDALFTLAVVAHEADGRGAVRFALAIASRPESTIVGDVVPGTGRDEVHADLDRVLAHLRAGLPGTPAVTRDGPPPACAGLDAEGSRFEAGVATVGVRARGGWKGSGDEEPDPDGDGCRGKGGRP